MSYIYVKCKLKMSKFWNYQCFKYFQSQTGIYSSVESNLKLSKTVDIIGPPDQLSNLRPIKFAEGENETDIEKQYRLARESTQVWNQKFWSEHNSKFIQERKQYQKELESQGHKSVTADEMSVFYKNFLDKNWKSHLAYNSSWYKQNIQLLFLEVKVRLSKFKFK